MIRAASVLFILILVACDGDSPLSGGATDQRVAVWDSIAVPDRSVTAYRLRQSLDADLVRAKLLKRGDEITGEEVEAAWVVFAERLGQERLDRLIASGVTVAELKDRVRARLEVEKLVEDDLETPITETEIREFYERNRSRYVSPPAFVAREIFLSASSEDARERRRVDMQRIVQELESGTEFAVLARRYSESDSAVRGGSTARLTRDSVDPGIWGVLSTLEVGEHRVASDSQGVYLLQLAARLSEREVSYDEARDEIVRNLQARRRSEAVSQALTSLRREAGIRRLETMGDLVSLEEFKQGDDASQRPR